MEFLDGKVIVDKYYRGAVVSVEDRLFVISEEKYKEVHKVLLGQPEGIKTVLALLGEKPIISGSD